MATRILFDALSARFGGGAYAAVQLCRHLAADPRAAGVVVVTREESIVQRGLAGAQDVRCVALPAAGRAELPRRLLWEATRLRALARREECDVLVTMAGLPGRFQGRRLVCLLGNPVMYERRTAANRLRRWATRRTAGEAVYLAAPSRLMADLVEASVGRACAVLPWGVDHDVFSPAPVPGREILCVADFYAHKRHDLLLEAWAALPAPRPPLRMIGNPAVDREAHARLRVRIAALPDGDSVHLDDRVPLDRLVAAYRAARVFVMPSEHESFCMPLAEGMACGAPAVARDSPGLRDTGGAGAVYVARDDPGTWAAAIQRLVEDDREHARARELAIRAAARFSWERCAATLLGQLQPPG